MARRPYPPARRLEVQANGSTVITETLGSSEPSPSPLSDAMTPNLGLTQPEVGASADTWGYKLNANMALIDSKLLPTAGGTVTGGLTVDGGLQVGANGIQYMSFPPAHGMAFGWNGLVNLYVDGSHIGDIATTDWVNNNYASIGSVAGGGYATTAWVQQWYFPIGGGTIVGPTRLQNFNLQLISVASNNESTLSFWNEYQNAAMGMVFAGTPSPSLLWGNFDGTGTPLGSETMALTSSGALVLFNGPAYKPGGGSWADTSDARLKRNVAAYSAGLEQVCRLRPISYEYNGLGGTRVDGRTYHGLIAQEAQAAMPELVGAERRRLDPDDEQSETDILTLDATALVFALVNCVRELTERVAALEKRNGS